MTSKEASELDLFSPLVSSWFLENLGRPTEIQNLAWPAIARGEHLLLSAPTGSGKTLSAFLYFLDKFIRGDWRGGHTQVLYISPLKALNNDIRKNLLAPLSSLKAHFQRHGRDFPELRVMTRSGDSTPAERQAMLRRPPEILITTPESFNLLLSTRRGSEALMGVQALILDEIHAIAGNKRGVHLMSAVERLAAITGEFQRIALSATVRPMERIARLVGGFEAIPGATETSYRPRPVSILSARSAKKYALSVRDILARAPKQKSEEASKNSETESPPVKKTIPLFSEKPANSEDDFWEQLVASLKAIIRKNRTTIIFVNSRAKAEALAQAINQQEDAPLCLCHHGSLSKKLRLEAEDRLKSGLLPAIVATATLELGIDIGSVDQVVLLQSPFTVASSLQRIGRAGHSVGDTSHADFFAEHARDLLSATLMRVLSLKGDIETLHPPKQSLDVLAQVIVSMCVAAGSEGKPIEEIYDTLRSCDCFHDLERYHFDLVLQMLQGRYAATRIPALKPRLRQDAEGRLFATEGSRMALFLCGGTIPNRGEYIMRLKENRARIGELDEEFVWERHPEDVFLFGNRYWRILEITGSDVFVEAVHADQDFVYPFWRAAQRNTGWHFAERLGNLLKDADNRLHTNPLDTAPLMDFFQKDYGLEEPEAKSLSLYLQKQRHESRAPLPHRFHIHFDIPEVERRPREVPVALLNFWGGKINQPLSLIIKAAWKRKYKSPISVAHDNDGVLFLLPSDYDPSRLFELFSPEEIPDLLKAELENSGLFGARFRENAGRALLLPAVGFDTRTPLALSRRVAKNLFEAVEEYSDFPIQIETWKNCLEEDFELEELKARIRELKQGKIFLSQNKSKVGCPMSRALRRAFMNELVYAADVPERRKAKSNLDPLLLEQILSNSDTPKFHQEEVRLLEEKLARIQKGYAPKSPASIGEILSDRIFWSPKELVSFFESVAFSLQEELWDKRQDQTNNGNPHNKGDRNANETKAKIEKLLEKILPHLCWVSFGEKNKDTDAKASQSEQILQEEELKWLHKAMLGLSETPPQIWGLSIKVRLESQGNETKLSFQIQPEKNTKRKLPKLPASDPRKHEEPLSLLAKILLQALYFRGPVRYTEIQSRLGLSTKDAQTLIRALLGNSKILSGAFLADSKEDCLCHTENYERLLRFRKYRQRQNLPLLELEDLQLFYAEFQMLAPKATDNPGEQKSRLQFVLDQLLGLPAKAELWESAILPARLPNYKGQMLDQILSESSLQWYGCPKQNVFFAFQEERKLFANPTASSQSPNRVHDSKNQSSIGQEASAFPATVKMQLPSGAFWMSQENLLSALSKNPALAQKELWKRVWQGHFASRDFGPIRKAVRFGFGQKGRKSKHRPVFASQPFFRRGPAGPSSNSKSGFSSPTKGDFSQGPQSRWHKESPLWQYNPPPQAEATDPLQEQHLIRNRIHQLMLRFGILFREITQRELPALRWRRILSELRLLELGGEIRGGYFIKGLNGLQFASHEAVSLLQKGPDKDRIYWMNACDPISLCGVFSGSRERGLPSRHPSNWLVFHGTDLKLILYGNARRMEARFEAKDSNAKKYFEVFFCIIKALEYKQGRGHIQIENINGEAAQKSPYRELLWDFGFVGRSKYLKLYKRAVQIPKNRSSSTSAASHCAQE